MKWTVTLILSSFLIAPGPAEAWIDDVQSGITFLFDRFQQKHPKTAVVAIPITGQITSEHDSPLSFEGIYVTRFWAADDSRNDKGKVTMKIEVVRDDQVIWKRTKKDRVKYDRHTGWQCGNCTHRLKVYNKFDDSLHAGDLVLFHFIFRGLPRFNAGEVAEVETHILQHME